MYVVRSGKRHTAGTDRQSQSDLGDGAMDRLGAWFCGLNGLVRVSVEMISCVRDQTTR